MDLPELSDSRVESQNTIHGPRSSEKTALLVIDFQNDFCSPEGVGAEYRGDLSRMAVPAQQVPRVVEFARKQGISVIFVLFIGDEKYQKPNWRERDRALGKRPKCCENTWGADFYGPRPRSCEVVFKKLAHFDAFLCPGFEDQLQIHRYEHLVLTGVYTDVCVDATARTAFQKGYLITVLSDCTTSLHHDLDKTLAFMRRVYGASIQTSHDFMVIYS